MLHRMVIQMFLTKIKLHLEDNYGLFMVLNGVIVDVVLQRSERYCYSVGRVGPD